VREYQTISLSEILILLKSTFHEERLLALLLCVAIYAKADPPLRAQIYQSYLAHTTFINNWDLVDASAPQIVGHYLMDKSRQPLYQLAHSHSLWERRISIMATFYFIKQGEFTEILQLAEQLLADKEDLIHKAVGWMLREIGKRDEASEEGFLRQYYRQMPRTMLRYAIEKFSPAKRELYLQGKI
jgi:3-methyladenine DNA glycosylase AlkD